MSLIGNKEKCVTLFVDNILWGNISIDWTIISNSTSDENDDIKSILVQYAIAFDSLKDDPEFQKKINKLYSTFVVGRILGCITGELQDKNNEKTAEDLEYAKQTIKEITANMIKLENDNTKLYDENIMLANELADLKNIVNSYEKASFRK